MSEGTSHEHGTVLLGKYQIESVLGRGGMGLVLKAWHLDLQRSVAIKILRDDITLDHETVTRFVREAQAAVKLKSEHVARITDVGMFEGGKPYMVMELLEGHDIGQLIKERGTLHPSLVIDLVLQTCDALAEAHSLGIIHRDIKPTNLFVASRPDGTALLKVLDFGISKATMGQDLSLTQTSSMLGTPAYMSPEQMRSARQVDTRTDIWSLGSVLYEAIEGHLPFDAETFSEMCVMVAADAPAPFVATPPELRPIILRCLEKSPDERYPSVAELAQDLARFAREPERAQIAIERMFRTLDRIPQPVRTVITHAGAAAQPIITADRKRPRRLRWAVLAALAAGITFTVIFVVGSEPASIPPVVRDAAAIDAAVRTPRDAMPDAALPDAAIDAMTDATPIDAPIDAPHVRHVDATPRDATSRPDAATIDAPCNPFNNNSCSN